MLTFEPITPQSAPRMRPYYADCSYHLCEYSVGVKLMWGEYLHPSFTEAAGCLIIRNELHGETLFDFPVPGEDGDVDAALTAIEDYCTQKGIAPVISVVPEQEAGRLALRYPRVHIVNERAWKDYLYRAEDLSTFAGRRYSGQRNHINKFRKQFPDARFVPLTMADNALIERFWGDYESEFHKDSASARRELGYAKELFGLLGTGWFCAGAERPHREGALFLPRRLSDDRTGLRRALRGWLRVDQPRGRRSGQRPAHLEAPVSPRVSLEQDALRGRQRTRGPA